MTFIQIAPSGRRFLAPSSAIKAGVAAAAGRAIVEKRGSGVAERS
jgi:hypothetical protein